MKAETICLKVVAAVISGLELLPTMNTAPDITMTAANSSPPRPLFSHEKETVAVVTQMLSSIKMGWEDFLVLKIANVPSKIEAFGWRDYK